MSRARAPTRPLSVLVVDGYPDAADSLADLLTLEGFAARIARSGADALAAAAEPPDVVVLDPRTPGAGWELAVRLGETVGGKRPLMVALTTDAAPAGRIAGATAGVDLYLVKPASPAALVHTFRRFARLIGRAGHPLAPPGMPGGAPSGVLLPVPLLSPARFHLGRPREPLDTESRHPAPPPLPRPGTTRERMDVVKLFVANLTTETTAVDLAQLVAPFGPVESADVWVSEGAPPVTRVGFVVLSAGGAAATAALDGVMYRGLELMVSEVPPPGERPAPEATRREAYAALIADRDHGTSVVRSRGRVARQFGLTRDQVAAIEREGAAKRWPPARGDAAC